MQCAPFSSAPRLEKGPHCIVKVLEGKLNGVCKVVIIWMLGGLCNPSPETNDLCVKMRQALELGNVAPSCIFFLGGDRSAILLDEASMYVISHALTVNRDKTERFKPNQASRISITVVKAFQHSTSRALQFGPPATEFALERNFTSLGNRQKKKTDVARGTYFPHKNLDPSLPSKHVPIF